MNDCDTLIYLHSSMHTLHESVGGQVQVNETSTITAGQHKYPHLLDIKNISLRILTDLLVSNCWYCCFSFRILYG